MDIRKIISQCYVIKVGYSLDTHQLRTPEVTQDSPQLCTLQTELITRAFTSIFSHPY